MLLSRGKQILGLTGLSIMACAIAGTAQAESAPAARADVFAQHSGGKIVYYYRVFNKSSQDIAAVSIGHNTKNDENPNNDSYELFEMPSGWNVKFGIPSTSSSSPTGWRVNLDKPEESSTHAITWQPLKENSPKLLAYQTLTKMSVAVDRADSNYLTGHVRVTFAKGTPANLDRKSVV